MKNEVLYSSIDSLETEAFRDYLRYLQSVRGLAEMTLRSYGTDLKHYEIYCQNMGVDPVKAKQAEVRNFIGDMGCISHANGRSCD
jgi:site-specific recombinase XerD